MAKPNNTFSYIALVAAIVALVALALLTLALYLVPGETLQAINNTPTKVLLFFVNLCFSAFLGILCYQYFHIISPKRMCSLAFRSFGFYAALSTGFSVLALPRIAQLTVGEDGTLVGQFTPLEIASVSAPNLLVCVLGMCFIAALNILTGYIEKTLDTEL